MLFLFPALLAAASSASGGFLDNTAVIVAMVSVIGTLGASWLMFRGKTQDTANWLIVELRNEAKSARESAQNCETKRNEDRIIIDDLRSLVAGLQASVRRLNRENDTLKTEVAHLKTQIELLR